MTTNTRTEGIGSLGLDVLLEVISHLDNISIVSLLEAWPSLKRHAILITDHIMPPLHFGIEGVTRKYTHNSDSMLQDMNDRCYFHKRTDRQSIRLIEVTQQSTVETLMLPSYVYSVPKETSEIQLSKTTFVFLDTHRTRDYSNGSYERMFEDTHSKWVMGSPTYFPIGYSLTDEDCSPTTATFTPTERREAVLGHTLIAFPLALENLVSLTIEICDDYFGKLILMEMKHLTVVFRSKSWNAVPEFSDIAAPKLENLVVRYTGFPPRFTKTRFLRLPTLSSMKEYEHEACDRTTSFELAYTPCLQLGTVSIPNCPQLNPDPSIYDDVEMSFTFRFAIIHFIAVPTFLVYKCDLVIAERVICHVHDVFGFDTPEMVRLQPRDDYILALCLNELQIYLCCTGAEFPSFAAGDKSSIALRLCVLAHNVEISKLWVQLVCSRYDRCTSLHMYQLPRLELERDEQHLCLRITSQERRFYWQAFLAKHYRTLANMTLSGFEIPLIEPPRPPETYLPNPEPPHMWLRPFVPADTKQVRLYIPLLSQKCVGTEKRLGDSSYLQVHPIFAKAEDRGKTELMLYGRGSLDGMKLRLCTSVHWKCVKLEEDTVIIAQESETDKELWSRTASERLKARRWDIPLYERSIYNTQLQDDMWDIPRPLRRTSAQEVIRQEHFKAIVSTTDTDLDIWRVNTVRGPVRFSFDEVND